MTLAQATNAVRQAFDAWVAVPSLKFTFGGFQSFGQAANTVTNADSRIRIQLHDLYGATTETNQPDLACAPIRALRNPDEQQPRHMDTGRQPDPAHHQHSHHGHHDQQRTGPVLPPPKNPMSAAEAVVF